MWIYRLRRDLRGHDATVDFDAAADQARQLNKDRCRRRQFRRDGRQPLPRTAGERRDE